MSSPTIRASNEWRVNGGDDILQIVNLSGTILGGIDSTSAGFGALAGGGGTPAGSTGDIQINNNGVFGTAVDINPASFVFVDSGNGGGFQAISSDPATTHSLQAGQNSLQVLGASGSNRVIIAASETGAHVGISADSSITITSASAGVSIEGGTNVLLTSDAGSVSINGIIEATFDSKIGFFAATPVVKPTVTGSKGANAALASLVTALAALGLVTDSTS